MDARSPTVGLETFGEQLRRLRSAAGISQDELAHRSGLSTAGVGALERGARRSPTQDTLILLAEALALDRHQLADLQQAAERGRARSSRPRPLIADTAHNLPLQLTSFIGRAEEIAQISRRIETNRLVTILGPGGVGKTRAALEVGTCLAESGAQEVRFVELAPLPDGTFIAGRIASVLDVRLPDAAEAPQSLARALQGRRVLLIFDNCEHLIASATEAARVLLQQCPQIKIITTTRERLGIIGEVVYRLPPLTVPNDDLATIAGVRSCGAVELFMQRTLAADPEFTFTDEQTQVLIDICRRLEGIPLAIELAAAQLPTLGLETLSRRLEAVLGASRGVRGVPARHQTMRDTLAWSCNLLSEPERSLLQRLGIFAGGCTLAAAEFVCSGVDLKASEVAGLLASLVDKSLVDAVMDGNSMRYMLLDVTRAYVREQLVAAGQESAVRRRHAQWLTASGQDAVREYLCVPNLVWLEKFGPELDNVRSALDWALRSEVDDDALLAGKIAGSFRGLWLLPGRLAECRRWIELIADRIDEARHPLVVADLLTALVPTLAGSDKLALAERLIALLRQLGDRRELGRRLCLTAVHYTRSGSLGKAQKCFDEALHLFAEDGFLESDSDLAAQVRCLIPFVRGQISVARGDYADARIEYERAWAIAQERDDTFALVTMLIVRAEVEFLAGDISLATSYAQDALRQADTIPRGSALKASALCRDAAIHLSIPDIDRAEVAARQAASLTSFMGDDDLRLISLQNLAGVAASRGRPQISGRLLGSIEAWIDLTGYRRTPFEEATYKFVVSSLRAQLGANIEQHISEGRSLDVELAAAEILSNDFRA